jgi:DNA-binding IscR family transcriptional regulator
MPDRLRPFPCAGQDSDSLKNTSGCSYGFYYNQLKNHIETTIKKLSVAEAVRDQLRKNYQVHEAERLGALKGTERHERVMGKQNLEDALKD